MIRRNDDRVNSSQQHLVRLLRTLQSVSRQAQVHLLSTGVENWNQWRTSHPELRPDLREAELYGAKLEGADLRAARRQEFPAYTENRASTSQLSPAGNLHDSLDTHDRNAAETISRVSGLTTRYSAKLLA